MKLAILVPCYNAAKFLPALFDGIKSQTIPFDEILCYDDCSTDNTAEVALKLGAKVIEGTENRGAAFARNRLIEATTCNWIHFHDADDLIFPTFVETMKNHIVDEHTQLLCNAYVSRAQHPGGAKDKIDYSDLLTTTDQVDYFLRNVGFAIVGLYSKFALTKIGGFNENLRGNEDPDLHIRLVNAGFKINYVPAYLVENVTHTGSFSQQNLLRCMQDKLKCLESYPAILGHDYDEEIGTQAARLSNFFYREGDKQSSKQARKLALSLGVKQRFSSDYQKTITRLFGLKFYLWTYRRQVDLRQTFNNKKINNA